MSEFLNGVIEGFYGRPWSPAQRAQLFEWMASWGMDTYVYAPKDDLKMRAAWRLPYDEAELAAMRDLLAQCRERGIAFVYTIAPGLDVRYADPDDSRALHAKLEQVLALGVRDFCVLFDDIPFHMSREDEDRFGSFASAQCNLANDMFAFVRQHGADGLFLFCPTVYCGRMAEPSVVKSAYLNELGQQLDPAIDVFWTGPEIVSETIPTESVQELRRVLRRKPLIWENLHANDYDIRRVYLGPFDGRPDTLRNEVRGVLTNPNDEFEANFIPIRSLALYASSTTYDAAAALDSLVAEWLPNFRTHGAEPITHEELALLIDVFYLPFSFGPRAEALMAATQRLLAPEAPADAPRRVRVGGGATLGGSGQGPATAGGEEDLKLIEQTATAMNRLFRKLTELDDRELLHALYSYVWEMRHALRSLAEYLRWAHDGRPGGRFGIPDRLPNTYAGGLVATLQRLLPLTAAGELRPRREAP